MKTNSKWYMSRLAALVKWQNRTECRGSFFSRSGSAECVLRQVWEASTMDELPEFRERGIAAVKLLQGAVYTDDDESWSILLNNESDLTDYFCQIGLALVIDRSEGIAYLKQFDDDERTDGYERLPRLFRKTPLGYEATLLCVLLRDDYRRFEDEDLDNERCVVETGGVFDLWKTFFPADSDEIALRKRLITAFHQLDKLKFVKAIPSDAESWEVRKLLKARITLQELESLRDRLAASEVQ